jgi:hypothetical protein
MRIFLISPVRYGTEAENNLCAAYVASMEMEGHTVHWPLRDTEQSDPVGKDICEQNIEAIRAADEVHVWWCRSTGGGVFDLGAAMALGKKIRLVNDVEPTPEKSFTNVLITVSGLPAKCERCGMFYPPKGETICRICAE